MEESLFANDPKSIVESHRSSIDRLVEDPKVFFPQLKLHVSG